MKITVDARLCSGQGRCYANVPEVFEPDDDGFCAQRGEPFALPGDLRASAELARDSCPEGAITVE